MLGDREEVPSAEGSVANKYAALSSAEKQKTVEAHGLGTA